jgi:hypothetical protein
MAQCSWHAAAPRSAQQREGRCRPTFHAPSLLPPQSASCLLFTSPEMYTHNHKTQLQASGGMRQAPSMGIMLLRA